MRIAAALIVMCLIGSFATGADDKPRLRFAFRDAPLGLVLEEYAQKSGKTVDVAVGVSAVINGESGRDLSLDGYLAAIEQKLKENNIGLFSIGEKRVVAAWIDPAIVRKTAPVEGMSYLERRQRMNELMQKAKSGDTNAPVAIPQLEQRDLLGSHSTKGPPLPIPLTEEMDDQLVREGVLPPRTDASLSARGTNAPAGQTAPPLEKR